MFKILLSIIFISNIALGAVTCKPVEYLKVSQPSPCEGYLFTPEKELEVRTKILDYERLTKITITQDELIQVMDKRLILQTDMNTNLRSQIESNRDSSTFGKLVAFGLGIVVASTIALMTQRK